mmetsp:Transcript_20002/g.32724  ORF Transcript_20002/g.32724 Transcript_20002/m.32724 type:complete len:437 (+) Transcript_20002:11-1321(+)
MKRKQMMGAIISKKSSKKADKADLPPPPPALEAKAELVGSSGGVSEGSDVLANFLGMGEWRAAKVVKVHTDGSLDILYSHGVKEVKVGASRTKATGDGTNEQVAEAKDTKKAKAPAPAAGGQEVPLLTPRLVVDCQNQLGESPVWDAAAGVLSWVDIEGKAIWQWDPTTPGEEAKKHELEERPGCMALTNEPGTLLAALDVTGLATFRPAVGGAEGVTALCPFEAEVANTRANDGRVDRQGRFLIGGYNETWRTDGGQETSGYYRLDGDGALTEVLDFKFRCANGTAFSPDGTKIYLNDSPKKEVWRFDYNTETGTLSNKKTIFTVPDGMEGVPDGACTDAEGYLWVAYNSGGVVCRHHPETGAVAARVAMEWKGVTSCSVGGADLDTLYITTNRRRMTPEEEAAHPRAGGLYAVPLADLAPGLRGLPEPKFKLAS